MGPFSLNPFSKESPVSTAILFANFTRDFRVFSVTLPVLLEVVPFQTSVAFCIETSNLILKANLYEIYMKCDTGLKWVNFSQEFFNNKILIV